MGDSESDKNPNYYPDPERLDIDFSKAEPFHYHIGESIVKRGSGLDKAERIGGLRRKDSKHRRIEIWHIPESACLLRVRRLQNAFYFVLNYDQLADEIVHLIEADDWRLDFVASNQLVAEVPDEYLPAESYSRAYFD
jgi:hypothetical protein